MTLENQNLVSIVIVSYKGKSLLEQFSASMAAQDYPHLEWIVVDNASHDGSAEWIEKSYPHWKVIRNPQNDGTAEGSNIGARAALGNFIFWISNDMWFEPDCISKIIARMQNDPSIGICTCKMRRITPDLQKLNVIDSVGGIIDFMGCPDAIGINEEDRGQQDLPREIFFSFGGAMMIRKKVFDETGGFDPQTFTLADDIDLSWRTRLLGYKVWVGPSAILYHRVSATLSKIDRGQRRFWSERNTLRMLLKNYSFHNLFWVLPCYSLCLCAELFFYLVVGRWDIGKRVMEAVSWNFEHGKETLDLKYFIQKKRQVSDASILRFMRKRPWKLACGLSFLKNPKSSDWKNFFGS